MLLEKLTKEELEFMECWHTPQALIESLFSNFDNLSEFSEDKLGNLRLYQFPFPSYEPIIDEEMPKLSEQEKFELRKGAGDVYNYGARNFGKTLITEKVDIPISILHDDGWWCGFSSTDAIHLDGVLDDVKEAVDNHPIVSLWKRVTKKSPKWSIKCKNNWKLDGINMNLLSKNPGHQFYAKHVKKLWIEEKSFESEKVAEKRKDAVSELGAVFRFSGMTNFTKHSPAGEDFYDPKNKNKIVNLPQFINPYWNEQKKQKRLADFGGEDSIAYRVFAKGEIVEDGVSAFDMERIKHCYLEEQKIKFFEITKDRYFHFRNLLFVTRPKNSDRIFICADIGESAGSEIIILSEVNDTYTYLYNIALYNLSHDEQVEIFKWLIEKLQANVVGVDCGDGTGRAVYRELEKIYSKANLVYYDGSKKLPVDFEKDNNGNPKYKQGKPVYKEEKMATFSFERLQHLLYNKRCRIPEDYKFDKQFNSVQAVPAGNSFIYKCVLENDHLFDAWRVFAIAQWLKKDFNQTQPMGNTEWCAGTSSWKKNKKKNLEE